MKKRLSAAVLAICLCATLLPATALGDADENEYSGQYGFLEEACEGECEHEECSGCGEADVLSAQQSEPDAEIQATAKLKGPAKTPADVTAIVEEYLAIVGKDRYWNANIRTDGTAKLKKQVDEGDYLSCTTTSGCVYSGSHTNANGCTSNKFSGVSGGVAQCWGYADYIEYVIFRTTNGSSWTKLYSVGSDFVFTPGDCIRYYDGTETHSVVVYKVSGSDVYLIAGNDRWKDYRTSTNSDYGRCHINSYKVSASMLRDKINDIKAGSADSFIMVSPVKSGGGGGSSTATPTISLSEWAAPSQINVGASFGLRGILTTDYGTITSVTGTIMNGTGDTTVLTHTDTPNASSYNIRYGINNYLSFGKLAEGYYVYTVTANANNNGKIGTFEKSVRFTVGNPAPAKPAVSLSDSDRSFDLRDRTAITLHVTCSGDTANGYYLSLETSNRTVVDVEWSETQVSDVVVVGQKPGSSTVTVKLIEYKTAKVLASASCSITIFCSHRLEKNWTEPTCTQEGIETATCTLCGYSYKSGSKTALGHNDDGGKVTKSATCTETGVKTHKCTRCGATLKTETIPALGHNYQNGRCTRCGAADPNSCPQYKLTDAVPETHWAHESIDYVLSRRIMSGTSDTTFEPNGTVTRAMVAVMLYNLSGEPAVSGSSPFSDVKMTDWFGGSVVWAYQNGIVSGNDDGTFNPNGKITREQLAIMMCNYAAYMGKSTSAGSTSLSKFADAGKVSPWATDAVKWAVSIGLISGSDEGGKLYMNPQGNATRAQIAVIFQNYCETFNI